MANGKIERSHLREAYRLAGGRHVADTLKRVAFVSALVAVTIAVLGLVVVSPLALRRFGSLHGLNWANLSNIGQTYGAASALLTGLALVGVAGSMIFQVRAINVSRAQSVREQHMHLVEMSLADPVYMRAWGDDPEEVGGPDTFRQLAFVNLIVSFWQDDYRLGYYPEHALRADFKDLFRGESARIYWARNRIVRLRESKGRRDRRFCLIAEEEYHKATAMGPPSVRAENLPPISPSRQQPILHNSAIKNGAAVLLGATCGIVIQNLLRQRKR